MLRRHIFCLLVKGSERIAAHSYSNCCVLIIQLVIALANKTNKTWVLVITNVYEIAVRSRILEQVINININIMPNSDRRPGTNRSLLLKETRHGFNAGMKG